MEARVAVEVWNVDDRKAFDNGQTLDDSKEV